MWPTTQFEALSDLSDLFDKLPSRVDAIFTADWHLRDTIPACRTEGFLDSQWRQMLIVSAIQATYDCPVIHAGDLFHHWKSSPELIAMVIKMLPRQFYTVYGNHDLPYHSMSYKTKSALYVLEVGRFLRILNGIHWGTANGFEPFVLKDRKIVVGHMVVRDPNQNHVWIDDNAPDIDTIFSMFDFDVFLIGHLHFPFLVEKNGRIVLNPGPLTVQSIDSPLPRIFLWNAGDNQVIQLDLPESQDTFLSREAIRNSMDSSTIDEFIQALSEFQSNLSVDSKIDYLLKILQEKHRLHPKVIKILYNLFREAQDIMEGENGKN